MRERTMSVESEQEREGDEAVRPLTSIARTLEQMPGRLEVEIHDHVIDARRGETSVLVMHARELDRARLETSMDALAEGRAALLLVGEPPPAIAELPSRVAVQSVAPRPGPDALRLGVEGLLERLALRQAGEHQRSWLDRYRDELGDLVDIARTISRERNLDRLLDLILARSRAITGADAGSIYVVERGRGQEEPPLLRFKLSQNDSCEFESGEFTMPVSTQSIAGYVALEHAVVNIRDVYHLSDDAPYGFDASFDRRIGYRTRSVIAVPMISAEDEVIGVIQLINKKGHRDEPLRTAEDFDRSVVPFDERSQELLVTLASQVGIALENALLYDEIRRIFEGFVHASVQAIEQRDPTTSGHSFRVSVLCSALARTVDGIAQGPYADVSFTGRDIQELEYAALLHDFGKIGVREEVLVKANKLYPHQLESIRQRIRYAIKQAEADVLTRELDDRRHGRSDGEPRAPENEIARRRQELEQAWEAICAANQPTVLSEGDFTRITEIGRMMYLGPDGEPQPLLMPEEVDALHITKGSLTSAELEEIRSHVVHTYDFLSRIPWGKSFRDVPRIAAAHHEKLDGSGYPFQLTSERIPPQSKIMTVCDIYDALTARDRPYKKAVPAERALQILGFEVDEGKLDPELVRIFHETEVYREVERHLEY